MRTSLDQCRKGIAPCPMNQPGPMNPPARGGRSPTSLRRSRGTPTRSCSATSGSGQRPGLSKRDRSLVTVAVLAALYRTNELPFHLKRALENGVGRDELVELITHLAFYAGWPTARSAVTIARRVFEESAA
jgi:4-carboxymuconolactone decarboxylase